MGEGLSGVLNSRIFSAYSLGLMVRNENLVFNTFELSIGIYPYLPDGESGFRLNPINTYRLKIRDFALPKPEMVRYD